MIGNLDTSATRLLRSLADGAVRTSTRARRGSYAPPMRLAQHLAPGRRRGYMDRGAGRCAGRVRHRHLPRRTD